MKKLILATLLSLTICFSGTMLGCFKKQDETPENLWTIQDVYAKAQDLGFEGTLEELIAMFKGEKGDKGDSGEQGIGISNVSINEKNELIITFTNNQIVNCGKINTPQPYIYVNDKNVLEFYCQAETFINSASTIYENLTATENYKNNEFFKYEQCVDFYFENKELFAEMLNCAFICEHLVSQINNEFYMPCQKFSSELNNCVKTFSSFLKTLSSYTSDVYNSIQSIKNDYLTPLKTLIISYGLKDLEEYEKENSLNRPIQEASLINFINKATMLHSILSNKINYLDESYQKTTNIIIVNKYCEQLNEIKEKLLEKYNSGIIKNKLEETYELIDSLYYCHVDIYTNNQATIDQLCTELNNNITILQYINEM